MKSLVVVVLVGLFLNGCVGAVPYWVRRSVVHDDVVLVKENNTLYRRYIPKGVWLKPNRELESKAGRIVSSNKDIKVFGSYEKAKNSGKVFKEHHTIKQHCKTN